MQQVRHTDVMLNFYCIHHFVKLNYSGVNTREPWKQQGEHRKEKLKSHYLENIGKTQARFSVENPKVPEDRVYA